MEVAARQFKVYDDRAYSVPDARRVEDARRMGARLHRAQLAGEESVCSDENPPVPRTPTQRRPEPYTPHGTLGLVSALAPAHQPIRKPFLVAAAVGLSNKLGAVTLSSGR